MLYRLTIVLGAALSLSMPVKAQESDLSPRLVEAIDASHSYNREKALTILTEECDKDTPRSCRLLLGLLRRSYDDKALEQARALSDRMCDDDDWLGCVRYAKMAEDGDGGPIDRKAQRTALVKACELGLASTCEMAGSMARDARGGDEDRPLALALGEKGCQMENSEACAFTGDLARADGFNKGTGTEEGQADFAKAQQYFKKACDLGMPSSCRELGELVREGRGSEPDQARALKLIQKGCNMDIYQCDSLVRSQFPPRP